MGTSQMRLHCTNCHGEQTHTVEGPNHIVHGVATLFTAGLWLLPWLIIAMVDKQEAQCERCGTRSSR